MQKDDNQNEIKQVNDILDHRGYLVNTGWSRDDMFFYDRSKIKVSPLRIKEWDYWEVFNENHSVILNIFDIGYAGVAQFSFTDFNSGASQAASLFKPLTLGSMGMPRSWRYKKPLIFRKGDSQMAFTRKGDYIYLQADFTSPNIRGEFSLYKAPDMDSMVNVIPFSNPRHFVYAVKIMCMPVDGEVLIEGEKYRFNQNNHSWGVLDWTRAVFPYRNQWKWCAASGVVDGANLGFNLDYGFGEGASSKSMIFYEGQGHHLGKVAYQHDWHNPYAPLQITSADERVNLVLTPKYAKKGGPNLGLMKMVGIKTYGFFTGELVLDDGTRVEIKESDRLFGWAEEFHQKW